MKRDKTECSPVITLAASQDGVVAILFRMLNVSLDGGKGLEHQQSHRMLIGNRRVNLALLAKTFLKKPDSPLLQFSLHTGFY